MYLKILPIIDEKPHYRLAIPNSVQLDAVNLNYMVSIFCHRRMEACRKCKSVKHGLVCLHFSLAHMGRMANSFGERVTACLSTRKTCLRGEEEQQHTEEDRLN